MSTNCLILTIFGAVSTAIIGFGMFTVYTGKESVFKGSGSPISMAQMLLSSIHITSQILLGVLIVTIISILIANQIISEDAGLPVLSVISGYLLGKNFKDVTFAPSKKTKPTDDSNKK